ncbi:polysaccharide deacetylase family protein [Leucobacter sp. CSA1]|uniref:Polysaccharide deacetylase family protein n=1 Tax=Leucobacter chromiisoli TaxID=2796471 RepID=A0A934Q746_9MICO|nr:polysaccharide deacetylase family protein [Leucobacter chromiisoli]MBK0417909.1 polysaccharide deacetylase family protein [Leucobacter chromiisoli]
MSGRRYFGLAFDLDGPSGDALVNGSIWRKPGYFAFGAYGPNRAVPRLLELLAGLGIRATFFTPAWVVRRWPELCLAIRDAGHELAGHGDRHEALFGLPADEQRGILERAQQTFLDVLGAEAHGFRAPSGDLDATTIALLGEHGYRYSSSFRSGDLPFRHEVNGLAELPAKSLFDDYAAFAYTRSPNFPAGLDRIADYGAVFRSWREEAVAGADEGVPVTSIWHPKIIGTPGRLVLLERFLRELRHEHGIRVTRCDEIVADYLGVGAA